MKEGYGRFLWIFGVLWDLTMMTKSESSSPSVMTQQQTEYGKIDRQVEARRNFHVYPNVVIHYL